LKDLVLPLYPQPMKLVTNEGKKCHPISIQNPTDAPFGRSASKTLLTLSSVGQHPKSKTLLTLSSVGQHPKPKTQNPKHASA
jgi:hypothetical protein